MSEPFLAEIKIVGFNFPPRGWATCDGQILPINQNQSLYSLLGTTYGGDGRTSFALPELRGRVPLHVGTGYRLGSKGGEEAHTLSAAEIPSHSHTLNAKTGDAHAGTPAGQLFAHAEEESYSKAVGSATFHSGALSNSGGGQSHTNMQPHLALNYVIALQGLFPSRS